MLSEKEIEKKLFEQAEMFNHYFRRREYLMAALCADWAAMVAQFVGLEEAKMIELFGDRQPDEPIIGLIREDKRIKAEDWCIFEGGYAVSRHTYQNVQRLL